MDNDNGSCQLRIDKPLLINKGDVPNSRVDINDGNGQLWYMDIECPYNPQYGISINDVNG